MSTTPLPPVYETTPAYPTTAPAAAPTTLPGPPPVPYEQIQRTQREAIASQQGTVLAPPPPQLEPVAVAIGSVLLLGSIGAAYATRVFRPAAVKGPVRCDDAGTAAQLWVAGGAMFFVWFAAQLALAPLARETGPLADTGIPNVQKLLMLSVLAHLLAFVVGWAMHQALPLRGARLGLERVMNRRAVSLVIIASVFAIPATAGASILSQQLFRGLGWLDPGNESHALLEVMRNAETIELLLAMISACILAPLFEEIVFRGHLQTALGHLLPGRWSAIVVSSLFFAAMHLSLPWSVPAIFLLSLGMGYAYERTGNLWVPIGIHVLFNSAMTALFMFSHW